LCRWTGPRRPARGRPRPRSAGHEVMARSLGWPRTPRTVGAPELSGRVPVVTRAVITQRTCDLPTPARPAAMTRNRSGIGPRDLRRGIRCAVSQATHRAGLISQAAEHQLSGCPQWCGVQPLVASKQCRTRSGALIRARPAMPRAHFLARRITALGASASCTRGGGARRHRRRPRSWLEVTSDRLAHQPLRVIGNLAGGSAHIHRVDAGAEWVDGWR